MKRWDEDRDFPEIKMINPDSFENEIIAVVPDQKHRERLMWEYNELSRKLSIAREALQWTLGFCLARDEMNAKVHCAPIRHSPITEKVILAVNEIDQVAMAK